MYNKPIGKHGANALFFLLASTPEGVFEALATTTLSSAVAVTDTIVNVVSATSIVPGRLALIDGEFMQVQKSYVSGLAIPVLRGIDGSAGAAHASGANVVHGLAADFANPPVGNPVAVTQPQDFSMTRQSYTAAGAIAFGAAPLTIAVLNGTTILAMTLAAPTTDRDGDVLIVVANGKAAHTVTAAGGFGANTTNSDVMTFHATQTTSFMCVACNGVWVLVGFVAGAATVAGPGLA